MGNLQSGTPVVQTSFGFQVQGNPVMTLEEAKVFQRELDAALREGFGIPKPEPKPVPSNLLEEQFDFS